MRECFILFLLVDANYLKTVRIHGKKRWNVQFVANQEERGSKKLIVHAGTRL